MKEMLETIAKYLVNNPDQVTVTEVEGEQSVILELRVAQEDMGRVIGKEGKIAKAIRTLVKANAAKLRAQSYSSGGGGFSSGGGGGGSFGGGGGGGGFR